MTLCSWAVGMVVDSMRGKPDVRATGNGHWRPVGKMWTSSPQQLSYRNDKKPKIVKSRISS